MGGLFGGFLSLVNAAGGGILYLLIGSKAWNETEGGRHYRLSAGSIAIGLIIGAILYFGFFAVEYGVTRQRHFRLALCLGGAAFAFWLVVRVLEAINKDI